MRSGARLFLLALSCFLLLAASPETEQPLNGYSAASSRTQREWETKFRAIPEPRTSATTCSGSPPGRTTSARRTTRTTPSGCSPNSRSGASTRRSRPSTCSSRRRRSARSKWSSRHASRPSSQEPAVAVDPTSNQQSRAAAHLQRLLDRRRRHRAAGLRELRRPGRLREARAPGRLRQRRDRDRALRRVLARHQAQGRRRARRRRLPHLFRSARRRLLPGRRLPERPDGVRATACSAAA